MTNIERECDRLWQECIRLKAHNRCRKCGGYNVSGHHLIKRRYNAFRWVLENGYPLCIYCHTFAEDKPIEFLKWLSIHEPRAWEWYDTNSCIVRIVRYTKTDLTIIRNGLRAIAKEQRCLNQ